MQVILVVSLDSKGKNRLGGGGGDVDVDGDIETISPECVYLCRCHL